MWLLWIKSLCDSSVVIKVIVCLLIVIVVLYSICASIYDSYGWGGIICFIVLSGLFLFLCFKLSEWEDKKIRKKEQEEHERYVKMLNEACQIEEENKKKRSISKK